MIFRILIAYLRFRVYGSDIAIEIRSVRIINLSLSLGNMIFLWSIRGIYYAKVLTVGGVKKHIMTDLGKKTKLARLGYSNVNNDLTSRAKMLNRFVKIVGIGIVNIKHIGNDRSEEREIRPF